MANMCSFLQQNKQFGKFQILAEILPKYALQVRYGRLNQHILSNVWGSVRVININYCIFRIRNKWKNWQNLKFLSPTILTKILFYCFSLPWPVLSVHVTQFYCSVISECSIGRTEKTKISKLTQFRVKFHVSIHRNGVHGLKKVIFVHFGLRSGLWR